VKSLVIVSSYHHKNTKKVASRIAGVRDCRFITPEAVRPQELTGYDLIGFGSGIYDARHHQRFLKLTDKLPQVSGTKAFIFSTDARQQLLTPQTAVC
jgi:flavodoxin